MPDMPDMSQMSEIAAMRAVSAGKPRLIQRTGRPMATDVSVQIAATPAQAGAAREAADACMRWFEDIDTHLSRFKPESELSRLNRAAGQWFAVSELVFTAVTVAVQAAQASAGLFDPTLLRQLESLGYDRDFALIRQSAHPLHIQQAQRETPRQPQPARMSYWQAIEFDQKRRRIRLPLGAQLDLGGIAKGWGADVALNRFCLPFLGALINVGGDLRVRGGPAPGEHWAIGIRDPRAEAAATETSGESGETHDKASPVSPVSHVAVLRFSRGGLATSGAVKRWWLRDGERRHHLLDPRTGQPVRLWIDERDAAETPLIATATALAPTAARAEVAAKMALLRGYPAALRAVETAWERPIILNGGLDADAAIALVLTFGNGDVVFSKNLPAYLASWGAEGADLPITIAPTPGTPGKSRTRNQTGTMVASTPLTPLTQEIPGIPNISGD